jgi:NADP-dependent 3-hydroxy acid dehydrogenase YdfG
MNPLDAYCLDDRVVTLTGASSGLGAGFGHAMAAVGAHLVLAARRTDRLGKLAAELAGAGTRVVTHTAEAAVTAPAGSWRSGGGTVRNLAVQDALADEAGPGADR